MKKFLLCFSFLLGACFLIIQPARANMLDDVGRPVGSNPELSKIYQTGVINGEEVYIGLKGVNHDYLHKDAPKRSIQIAYNAWDRQISNGFGEAAQVITIPYIEHKGWLYFSVWDLLANDPEIWRVKKGQWEQIRPAGYGGGFVGASSMAVIDGYVYYSIFGAPGGAEVWRTNGTTTEQVGLAGFGDANNERGRFLGQHEGYTYIGFDNDTTGAELWRSRNGNTWFQVNTDGFGDMNNESIVHEVVYYNGYYYASTLNDDTGTEVWRSKNGASWTQVNPNGFGDSDNEQSSLYVHNGRLYASTRNTTDGFQIWRTKGGTNWTNKMTGGFGNPFNFEGELVSVDGRLYVSTLNYVNKAGVWRTKKAKNWKNITPSGMNGNDVGVSIDSVNGQAMIATINWINGTKIWYRSKKDDNWERYNEDGMNNDPNNDWAINIVPRKKYIFAGIENYVTAAQVWRLNFSPGPITNLEILNNTPTEVVLKWQAPGGQDRDHYVIKRYKEPLTEQNWHLAKLIDNDKVPKKRKSNQKKYIKDMPTKGAYYFGVKTIDSNGIESALSNVPVAIRNLEANNVKRQRATLEWSEDKTAQYYNVQIRTQDGQKLKTWKEVANTKKVTPSGWLDPGTTYKFRVRSVDWQDKAGAWSPYQSFTTNN